VNQRELEKRATLRPPAVVLQTSYANGLGVIRNLARNGVPVLAVDPNPRALGFSSRYAACAVCPDPAKDLEAFVAFLEELGARLPQRAVIFPTHDEYIWPVSRHAERLSTYYRIPFSGWETMQRLYDKEEQMRAAWRADVDTPLTAFIRSADDLAAGAEAIPFPAIFKPVMSLEFKNRFKRPVLVIDSPAELEEVYARATDCGVLMLQEIVPGGDDELYSVGSTLDAQSRPLAVFTGKKIRQHPRTFGTARLAESIWIPEAADAGLRLLRELHYHGVSQVEFKRDHRDGRYKLMEVNARHWLWHSLAPACGVNLTLASYADAIGRPFQAPPQKDGRKWVLALKEGVDSLNELRRGQQRPVGWLRSLAGVRVDGVIALDDPAPGAVNAWRMAKALVRRRGRRTGRAAAEEIEL
jgi:predicted ATP-grasp superfamily ATP-dependent carboligase